MPVHAINCFDCAWRQAAPVVQSRCTVSFNSQCRELVPSYASHSFQLSEHAARYVMLYGPVLYKLLRPFQTSSPNLVWGVAAWAGIYLNFSWVTFLDFPVEELGS